MTKLKVLFVRPTLGQGGADKVTVTVLRNLDRARFEPHLTLLRAEGVWLDRLPDDVGLHLLGVPRVRGMLPALVKLIRQLRPDVVFSTSSGTNVVAIAAAKLCGCRVVVSERNVILNGGLRPPMLVQWLLKAMAYRLADDVTAVCGGVADDMSRKLRMPRIRIRSLLNPTVTDDLRELAGRSPDHPWLAPGNRTVVAAGRLVPPKGFPILLKAFAEVHRQLPSSRLLILGEGPELGSLRKLAAELGTGDSVEFVGFQKNPYAYFSKAAAFSMSSFNEGLPNVLIEAMACGAAVVATDCPPGLAEVVEDGVNGFLVPVGDSRGLAERLLRMLTDRAVAERMGRLAKESSSRFTVDSVLKNYASAIEAAVA